MAVIVEVPDEQMSRRAKRLIGRRSGVRVVVSGEPENRRQNRNLDPEPPRKIVVREDEPASASEVLELLHDDVWAALSSDPSEVDSNLRRYVDMVRAGSSPLINDLAGERGDIGEFMSALRSRASAARTRFGRADDTPLSERETQILQRISQGVTSAEIAEEMGFQLQTVKNKVTTILTKTQARSRTHAVAIALTRGWIRSA